MTISKITMGSLVMVTLIAINCFAGTVSAQKVPKPPPCTVAANQIYFVASGQSVKEVHPGINDGNGYQLNILGTDVDKFEVIQERYLTSLSIIPNYTSSTAAKWSVVFAPNMGQEISSLRMRSRCDKGRINVYQLTESITLLDQ